MSGYALATTALVLAVLIRWLLDPLLGNALPLVTLFAAVAVTVWAGGYLPAGAVALIGYLACSYLFIPPRGSLAFGSLPNLVEMIAYLFTCGVIIGIAEAMRTAKVRANHRRDTHRRDAQEKAEELVDARQLASIVESSGDAIIGKSLEGTIQNWNDAAERVFGYTAEEAVGRNISLVIPPDRVAEEDHIIATLKAGQRIDHFETERVRKDGRRILVSLTVSPIKDDEGNIVGASKVVRDVTLQRRADERERRLLADAAAANAKFQAFFEQGALLAVIMELDGTIVAANRLSWEGCGYRRDQIVGKRFWEGPWWASSPALARQMKAAAAQAIAGSTFRGETSYFVADGSERTADITIVPIKDETGKVLFVAPTGIDITDRKRAEADRQKFVTLVENSSDFISMLDLQGVPFFINRAGLEMVGLDNLEQARQVPLADYFFPEDRPMAREEFSPPCSSRATAQSTSASGISRPAKSAGWRYKVLTLPDAAGRPMAFATVSQDVTERRRLADNLRMVASDLSEANRRKTEFLAMLAHELRNPLAPISNAVRALRVGHGDAKVARAALGMFERQVGQLARLVDDLLDLSRVTRGKIVLRKQPVELVPIVEQAVEAARARYGSLDQELTVTLPTQPVYLSADPARLAQVIGNLLNNACKFTDPDGHIGLTVSHEGTQAVVRVRDNGIGIAAEQLPHLFTMFTQADTSLERTRDGLGIGLTLVKAVVEMHGGTVEARSEGLGRGSEFEVRLAALEDASATIAQAAESEPTTRVGHRVLIVDDNYDGAESLAMLLEEVGHETHLAHDGVEALEVAERIRPDAVLLDIGLPKLNGYEVCQRLRERPWGR